MSIAIREAASLQGPSSMDECAFVAGKEQFVVRVPLASGDTLLAGRLEEPRAYLMHEKTLRCVQQAKLPAYWAVQRGSSVEVFGQTGGKAAWHSLARIETPPLQDVWFCLRKKVAFVGLYDGSVVRVAALNERSSQLTFRELVVPSRCTVIGLDVDAQGGPALVLLSADRYRFELIGRGGSRVLLQTPQPALRASYCQVASILLYTGKLTAHLYDVQRARPLWDAALEGYL